MAEQKDEEIIGYYTDEKSIYCVDCILKAQEIMKKNIEKAITSDDAGQELIFCDDCKKEIK